LLDNLRVRNRSRCTLSKDLIQCTDFGDWNGPEGYEAWSTRMRRDRKGQELQALKLLYDRTAPERPSDADLFRTHRSPLLN
jgi:hypothetical protein